MTRLAVALTAMLLLLPAAPAPAAAQERTVVVVPQPPGLVETAIASCAGGAAIGVPKDVRHHETGINSDRGLHDLAGFGAFGGPVKLLPGRIFRVADQGQRLRTSRGELQGDGFLSPRVFIVLARQYRVEASELRGGQKHAMIRHALGNFDRTLETGYFQLTGQRG